MVENGKKRILFAGYAPVHFRCFRPIYDRLRDDPRVELRLSGGLRGRDGDEPTFDAGAMYRDLPVDHEHVIPFEEAREQSFDVTVCAHTSGSLLPRSPGRTVQIFHGVSFKNFAVREKVLSFDVLCLPGRYHAELFRELGLVRAGGPRLFLTGFAKADRLAGERFDRDSFLRSFGLDPAHPTILFAPTGGKHNALETVGEEVIAAIAGAGRWNLMVKPHDHPKRPIDVGRLTGTETDRVRVVRTTDVIDYLRAADLLLTDASSVAVEYTLLDRPIVFIDVPKLLKNVLKRGAPLDLTTYGRKIGRLAGGPHEVVSRIEEALAAPTHERELRRAMAREVFHLPGGASDRVCGVVRWAAGLDSELPTGVEELTP